eukprot:CAMPEP_0182574192 /NCGR_PEP_ID=MMETSP1324-20130603/23241_1 /TAXON_ID=236786 /ORGANISM="Florenciella sp., Strain RCC1587" /LENGTH=92 /DNA_ID=CAMNT_0024789471 /DNA_START=322 /DNA_END=596 /DNA_ORIENTATION=+
MHGCRARSTSLATLMMSPWRRAYGVWRRAYGVWRMASWRRLRPPTLRQAAAACFQERRSMSRHSNSSSNGRLNSNGAYTTEWACNDAPAAAG